MQKFPIGDAWAPGYYNQPRRVLHDKSRYEPQEAKRNKLLHRFYEPLVLLYVLDRTQGDHISRQGPENIPFGELQAQELRRRFLDSLSYVCDSQKGGETTTAIAAASAPLTYYIACNRDPKLRVVPFLQALLAKLGALYDLSDERLREAESEILQDCVDFGGKRIQTYSESLQRGLAKCLDASPEPLALKELRNLQSMVTSTAENMIELCMYCDRLRRSSAMDYIKQRAISSERHGNNHNPFTQVRHFVGRLTSHIKAVRVLVSTARNLSTLFLDPGIEVIPCQGALTLPPDVRNKLNLKGIANRMVNNNLPLLLDIQRRLQVLNQNLEIERIVREEYANKNFKPRVHAELILLEHFYRNRERLEFVDDDSYIGCSKPACYCCYLYIRAHPGQFVEPATHQKIYLNWMPPTSLEDDRTSDWRIAEHERTMLNRMVETIRAKTIEQIVTQTGRRPSHYDSVTGNTFSALDPAEMGPVPQEQETFPTGEDDAFEYDTEGDATIISEINAMARSVTLSSNTTFDATESDIDSDEEGGVSL